MVNNLHNSDLQKSGDYYKYPKKKRGVKGAEFSASFTCRFVSSKKELRWKSVEMHGICSFPNITSRGSSDFHTGNSKHTKKYFAYVSKSHVQFPTALTITIHGVCLSMALQLESFSFPCSFKQSVGLLGRGCQPVARPLPADRTAQTQNKRKQTSIPQVGFKLTIPVLERAKTVHVLDRAVTPDRHT
jgi:hypothetical protein